MCFMFRPVLDAGPGAEANPVFYAANARQIQSFQIVYPKARHTNNGFQNTPLNKDFFDAVVGNPPFGNQALYDPDYPELKKFSIHNYFISKSLDLLREGGVGAFVVSRYFMDAVDPSVREHIAQSADFLGAVRLPETAFRQNALTDVTTDIVFFQKNSSENKRSKDWTRTASIVAEDHKNGGTKPATVNSYFAANPGQIIGKMAYSGGMFHDALNCVADAPLMDLGHEITKRLEALPGNLYVPRTEAVENAVADARNEEFISSAYFQSLKMGALCVEPQSQKIVFKTAGDFGGGSYDVHPVKNDTARQRLASMIQVRDTLRDFKAKKIVSAIVGDNNTVIVNEVKPVKRAKPKYPEGCIGHDTNKANYIGYLVGKYHEYKVAEVGKAKMNYAIFLSSIKRQFSMGGTRTIYNIPIEKFEEVCSVIKKRIDGTILGKNKGKTQRNYSSFDEYVAK